MVRIRWKVAIFHIAADRCHFPLQVQVRRVRDVNITKTLSSLGALRGSYYRVPLRLRQAIRGPIQIHGNMYRTRFEPDNETTQAIAHAPFMNCAAKKPLAQSAFGLNCTP